MGSYGRNGITQNKYIEWGVGRQGGTKMKPSDHQPLSDEQTGRSQQRKMESYKKQNRIIQAE